ncbi:MAG: CDP-diacylglycerol--glycerol-3-phosphate 3-phosphatidyltransferase [Candidatus Omnitrophica bacterium]|nr:CDP-diacylglycerol--glycerol-3-phosphate 3-phosphatidyltransferase [Candidatus Omnitrophota bacterium]
MIERKPDAPQVPAADPLNWPNRLTFLRVLLVPAVISCVLSYAPGKEQLFDWALALFISACVTDALDGYLARRLGQMTPFGALIDPLADKLLIVSAFVVLCFAPNLPDAARIPAWVAVPVLTRDIVLLAGSMIVFMATGDLKAKPNLVGKATTCVQMLTLIACLARLPIEARSPLFVLTVILTLASGWHYVRSGARALQGIST